MRLHRLLLASFALCLLALAGCESVQLASHVAKTMRTAAVVPETRPLPRGAQSHYKLGAPYAISGNWYYPSYDPSYDRTGIASWYGPGFHGRPTANGERFDMNAVSAAHPTLPLPSRVRVTNLENGRQLDVRVNDRGPFIDDRLIDLSRRAAQLLGFHREGLARVRVEYLGLDDPLPDAPPAPADRPVRVATADAPPVVFKPRNRRDELAAAARVEPVPQVKPVRTAEPAPRPPRARIGAGGDASSQAFLIEAAVLEGHDAAQRLGARVRSFGSVAVEPERRGGRLVYAVRIGPVDSDDEAASIVARLARAGVTGSQIVAAKYR